MLKLIFILGIFLNTSSKCAEQSGADKVLKTEFSVNQCPKKSTEIMRPLPDGFRGISFMPMFSINLVSWLYSGAYSGVYANFISGPYAFMHLVGTVW